MSKKLVLKQAADIIKSGGVIACPTESVYGFSCDPNNRDSIIRILKLKKRDLNKGFILVAGDLDYFENFIKPLDNKQKNIINDSVIGFDNNKKATSWLVPASDNILPEVIGNLSNKKQVVIRVSKHPVIAELTKLLGFPIISTSANISGEKPCDNYKKLMNIFSDIFSEQNIFVINDNCWGLEPSCIRDISSEKILRI